MLYPIEKVKEDVEFLKTVKWKLNMYNERDLFFSQYYRFKEFWDLIREILDRKIPYVDIGENIFAMTPYDTLWYTDEINHKEYRDKIEFISKGLEVCKRVLAELRIDIQESLDYALFIIDCKENNIQPADAHECCGKCHK